MENGGSVFSLSGLDELEIGVLLTARLLYPNAKDTPARETFIISCALSLLHSLESTAEQGIFTPESEEALFHSDLFYKMLYKIGGWKTLWKHFSNRRNKHLSHEISIRIENAFISGCCLRYALERQTSIQAIAEEISADTVYRGDNTLHFEEGDGKAIRPCLEKENITINVWRTFKDVAHYWAALLHYSLDTLNSGLHFFNLTPNDAPTSQAHAPELPGVGRELSPPGDHFSPPSGCQASPRRQKRADSHPLTYSNYFPGYKARFINPCNPPVKVINRRIFQ